MAKVRITDLLLRTIIGTNDWERKKKQDVIINISLEYDSRQSRKLDSIKTAVDYRSLTKRIVEQVESSQFFLLESLADFISKMIMENSKVKQTTVRVDKPHALRFARSVSIELSSKR